MATKNSVKTYEEPAVAVLEEPPPTKDLPPEITPLVVTPASFITPKASDVGTHLRGPLMIGNPGEAGIALLGKRAHLNAATAGGTFSGFAVKFPPNSILTTIYVSILTTFNGTTPSISFGRTVNGVEFGALTALTAAPGTIKLDVTAILQPANIVYISAILTGSTVGEAAILMVYSGAPLKTWQ